MSPAVGAGHVYKYDLALPLEGMYSLVDAVRERMQPFGSSVVVTGYGHVGDQNLHLNVTDGNKRPGTVRNFSLRASNMLVLTGRHPLGWRECLSDHLDHCTHGLAAGVQVCSSQCYAARNVHESKCFAQEIEDALQPFVYDWTNERRGSVSAEHGIGALKREYLHLSQSGVAIQLMAGIKKMLDPNYILNPHKVLLDEYL
jgi:FAD/FMN-containing dehydrogenase